MLVPEIVALPPSGAETPDIGTATAEIQESGQQYLVLGARRLPVVLPRLSDPRLRLSAVIMSLQVLGQTVLGFKVSIAQIVVSIGVCAMVDTAVVLWRDHVLAWPASGMLTGNSVAFILRASGTRHGDWWTLHGIQYFVLACIVSLLSKYLIRLRGRHLFNPSNVGLVVCLLVIGPGKVFPQYLYWGPVGAPVAAATVVILVGAVWILRSVRMAGMAVAFLTTFATAIAIFALAGRGFVAIWSSVPVVGRYYLLRIVASPELLIFVFFMMSDPQTTPRSRKGRLMFGATTALVAAGLVYFQTTEFGVKLAILSSLTVACALVPVIERSSLRLWPSTAPGTAVVMRPARRPPPRRPAVLAQAAVVLAAVMVAVGAPAATSALASNPRVILIERGQTGSPQ
jgi:Na+-translocating ferredoxin:NAD+ oxidoreductase RnfD subunit